MRVECPFCGTRYSVKKKDAESIVFMGRIRYGYDPVDREKNVLVWPCTAHTHRFELLMKMLRERRDRAMREYEEEVRERIKRLKAQIFRVAENLVREELGKLGDGEGLLVWVSDGVEEDGEYRDLVVAYVNMNGEARRVYGDLKPRLSYVKGRIFSATHYIAQDLDILLYKYRSTRWKGIIQGLVLNDSLTRRVVGAVFSMTHIRPNASLLDFIRYPEGLGSTAVMEAKASAEKINAIYVLAEPYRIRGEVEERITEKYGVPVGIITPKHLLQFIKRETEKEKEEVSN